MLKPPDNSGNWKWDSENQDYVYVEPTIPLNLQLDTVFSQLPNEAQAAFFTLRAGVKLALEENKPEIAKMIIENAPVPPELQSVKDALLQKFS